MRIFKAPGKFFGIWLRGLWVEWEPFCLRMFPFGPLHPHASLDLRNLTLNAYLFRPRGSGRYRGWYIRLWFRAYSHLSVHLGPFVFWVGRPWGHKDHPADEGRITRFFWPLPVTEKAV